MVHHPDPLTSEQTQRFLDTVTTSFRKNLDQEHSWNTEDGRETKTPLNESHNQHNTTTIDAGHNVVADRAHLMARGPTHRPTDRHLSSILSNPLFRPAQHTPVEPGAERDPMDVFDAAVSKGLMTLAIARGCIIAKSRMIDSPHGRFINDIPAINEGLSRSGVSDRVLGWLQSAGMTRTLEFARYYQFVQALVPFLIAEGKELIIWDWISRILSSNDASRENDARFMLYNLVIGKTLNYQPVDSAIESLIQASRTYRSHPRHASLLRRTWISLAWRTTAIAPRTPPASASLFDTYLGLAEYFQPQSVELQVAHLHLHHPATPTHDRALEYFDDMESQEGDHLSLDDKGVVMRRKEAVMAFDACNHLSLIGKFEEADSLMDLIRSRYREFMGLFPGPSLSYLEQN